MVVSSSLAGRDGSFRKFPFPAIAPKGLIRAPELSTLISVVVPVELLRSYRYSASGLAGDSGVASEVNCSLLLNSVLFPSGVVAAQVALF